MEFFMSTAAQPAKRSPSTRKAPARPAAQSVAPEPSPEPAPKPAPKPSDPRIGENIDDPRVKFVTFADGTEYRCDNGVIVERVRR